MSKPSLPQGTRDFGPDVVRKRTFILNTIKNVFELYGFQPLETPAMENIETLMGKYGEEGDKLIFKILNNGLDNPEKEEKVREDFEKVLQGKNTKGITERALKYDLTIPFARYVVMNHQNLAFPFKRYQIQPVWRADRPQKGRYREFYQCDADVVGSNSLVNEVELALIYQQVFSALGMEGYELRINHRKIFTALADLCGGTGKSGSQRMNDIAIAIDKLDKIGLEKVKEELGSKGLNETQINTIDSFLNISGTNEEILKKLTSLFEDNENARIGINQINEIVQALKELQTKHLKSKVIIDPTLARGLNYYTGIIIEVKAPPTVKIGSIGGGGRYDDLTGLFGVPNIPGVGISFGVDRIYDVMEEMNLFPKNVHISTQVLFFNLGEKESKNAFELMQQLREKNVSAELFHETAKFDKQFKYAEKKGIPYIIIIGSKEMEEKTCTIKHLPSGKQELIAQDKLLQYSF